MGDETTGARAVPRDRPLIIDAELEARRLELGGDGHEALRYAARAVAATLDLLQEDAHEDQCEVYHMLASVLRHPEVML